MLQALFFFLLLKGQEHRLDQVGAQKGRETRADEKRCDIAHARVDRRAPQNRHGGTAQDVAEAQAQRCDRQSAQIQCEA